MGSEIYDNDAPSPVPEKIRQTDKSQWRWNWFGSISNPSKVKSQWTRWINSETIIWKT